ncbi:YybH family protein [Pyruvatibacter mobilis]|uniref:YybH family protein n=1 Tax=Pyruvatibacter mobilis TaxID=1712261 RepID=UPI003BB15236
MSQHAALLFANEAFYRAFADKDMRAMANVWAHDDTVRCLHPGWAPLIGVEEVLGSFQAIFDGPAPPAITPAAAEVAIHGAGPDGDGAVGIVTCYERIGGDFLLATNIFRREKDGGWRLVHHQAGPANDPPPEEDDDGPDTIN